MNYNGLQLSIQAFYRSAEWSNTRKQFLAVVKSEKRPFICAICGIKLCFASSSEKYKIGKGILNIDHILPVRKYWEKRCDINNLQMLCQECNSGKLNLTDKKEILKSIEKYKLQKQKEDELKATLGVKYLTDWDKELLARGQYKKDKIIPQLIKPKNPVIGSSVMQVTKKIKS